jgi:hypothetical protein
MPTRCYLNGLHRIMSTGIESAPMHICEDVRVVARAIILKGMMKNACAPIYNPEK